MAIESWLPISYVLPDGAKTRRALFAGLGWQIVETQGGGRALLATDELITRWMVAKLVDDATFAAFEFCERHLGVLTSDPKQSLSPIADDRSPNSKTEALAFANAMKATRAIDNESPLQDAIYVERINRLLPTYSISSRTDDATVLGYWLTGGANVSATSFRRARQMLSWLGAPHLKEVIESAGFTLGEIVLPSQEEPEQGTQTRQEVPAARPERTPSSSEDPAREFELPGRPELAAFFNEHVVDVVRNQARYAKLGIGFPSAMVLHGPPGCGKTFAVEQLIDFLGWPSYSIDASSVASSFIHETSKKVAALFELAIENAPSVLVIDEMEAFLADREMGSGSSHHRIEEVAEFLRRIPAAVKKHVLILAMTNRIEMIDPAILRRGRFDHVIKVDFASEAEVYALLEKLLVAIPTENDVDVIPLAKQLAGRPLSDVSFVVREGARLAARAGRDVLDNASLVAALGAAPARGREGQERRRIGFV